MESLIQEILNCKTRKTFDEVSITPEIATLLLHFNEGNRPVKKAKVAQYADQMKTGNFKNDGNPIGLDINGKLINGQHRLFAVIKSGATIFQDVKTGFEEDIFAVMDTGIGRGGADVLAIAGHTNTFLLSATIKQYKRMMAYIGNYISEKKYMSNDEVIKFVDNSPFIIDAVRMGNNYYNNFKGGITPSIYCALVYTFYQLDAESCKTFFALFTTGEGISREQFSSVYWLRDRIVKDMGAKAKLPEKEKVAIMIKGWNAFRKSSVVKFVRWDASKEQFPKAI